MNWPCNEKTFFASAVIGFKEIFRNMYSKVPLSSRWTVPLKGQAKERFGCVRGGGITQALSETVIKEMFFHSWMFYFNRFYIFFVNFIERSNGNTLVFEF